MEKDYAKRFVKQPAKKRFNHKKWMMLFLILMLIIATFLVIAERRRHDFKAIVTRAEALFAKHTPPPSSLPVKQNEKSAQELHFSFYKELPNMQVASSLAAESQEAAPVKGYFLQFGTFKELLGASQLRISLLLAGVAANIEKIEQGNESFYQVQQGPYTSLNEVKARQKKWHGKGIESVIKKVG